MLLAIDVGNTQTVLGVYDGEHLVHMWRVATNVDHTSDELRIKLHVLMAAEGVDPKCIDGAILASVVPALTHNWEKACYRSFCVQLLVISAQTVGHLIDMDQEKFAELGADRVADAAAAKCLYGSPVDCRRLRYCYQYRDHRQDRHVCGRHYCPRCRFVYA